MRAISGHQRPACAPPGVPIPWREVINPTMPPLDIRHDQVPPSWSARPHTPSSNICDTSHRQPLLAIINTAQNPKSGRTHTEPPFVLPDCVSFTQRPVRPTPAVFQSRTQEHILRFALLHTRKPQYMRITSPDAPQSPLPFRRHMCTVCLAAGSQARRKAWDGGCEACVCAPPMQLSLKTPPRRPSEICERGSLSYEAGAAPVRALIVI